MNDRDAANARLAEMGVLRPSEQLVDTTAAICAAARTAYPQIRRSLTRSPYWVRFEISDHLSPLIDGGPRPLSVQMIMDSGLADIDFRPIDRSGPITVSGAAGKVIGALLTIAACRELQQLAGVADQNDQAMRLMRRAMRRATEDPARAVKLATDMEATARLLCAER